MKLLAFFVCLVAAGGAGNSSCPASEQVRIVKAVALATGRHK